ncbi:hypothetical protein BpHYR1_039514 [Brachionus plicatilis]|uniref:Uncharacterized protein n=1 Tax=Brachionus plicatilis TaxID=10195 RepID=A0A3M7R375_BRAPC|nr:hypothetical protein BpHYR1_039514 [Brachionus plicatilis]
MLKFQRKSLGKQKKPSEQTKNFNREYKQTNIESINLELCKENCEKQMTFFERNMIMDTLKLILALLTKVDIFIEEN